MISLLDNIIIGICYLIATLGLWFFISPFVLPGLKRNINVLRFKKEIIDRKKRKKTKFEKHIEMLITVTFNTKTNFSILTFYLLSISLLVITYFVFHKSGAGFTTKAAISIMAGLMPYIILRVRLHNIRIEASYEAEGLVTELTNQYKINYLNMIEAIDQTVFHLKRYPYSKKVLSRMSMEIKHYRNKEELDDIIQEFTFAINTQWAVLLANNINLSVEYGDDVNESLNDILNDIKDIKGIIEKNKQFNNEAFVMIKVVAPLTYIMTVIVAIKFFGFTIQKFINYQFYNATGLKFFIIAMATVIINYIIYVVIKKPKYDFK